MISLDTPLSGLDGLCLQDFWELPVSKDFDQPQYYLGQTVLHCMKVPQGEILHPVEIVGISWTGDGWDYEVWLPSNHPKFEKEDREIAWLREWQLEAL